MVRDLSIVRGDLESEFDLLIPYKKMVIKRIPLPPTTRHWFRFDRIEWFSPGMRGHHIE